MKTAPIFRIYKLYTRANGGEQWAYWGETEPMSMGPEQVAERSARFRGGQWKAEVYVWPNGATAMIQLQGYGWHSALPVKDLKPGMTILWNHFHNSTVVEVKPLASGKTLTLVTRSPDGKTYERRYRSETLLAVDHPANE